MFVSGKTTSELNKSQKFGKFASFTCFHIDTTFRKHFKKCRKLENLQFIIETTTFLSIMRSAHQTKIESTQTPWSHRKASFWPRLL